VLSDVCTTVSNASLISTVEGPTTVGAGQVALSPLCQVQAIYEITTGSDNVVNGQLQSVSRGIAWGQIENEFFMGNMNQTGTRCTISGGILKCTYTCYGDLCNSISKIDQIPESYYNCWSCSASYLNQTEFNNCLYSPNMYSTVNQWQNSETGQITINMDAQAGNNVCQTVVQYSNEVPAQILGIYRGNTYPSFFPGYGTGAQRWVYQSPPYGPSTLGYCYNATQAIQTSATNIQDVSVVNCVKNCLYNDCNSAQPSELIAPNNATCYQCSAVAGDANYADCLNPNMTSNGQNWALCGNGQDYCSSVVVYDTTTSSSGTVAPSNIVGVQRMCMSAEETTYDGCWQFEKDGSVTNRVLCMEQCKNSGAPCNDAVPQYETPSTPPVPASGSERLNGVVSFGLISFIIASFVF